MEPLTSYQKQYLKGLGHHLKPLVFIGRKGLSESLQKALVEALDGHELVKVRFQDFKDKELKADMAARITRDTGSSLVGMVGHVAMLYRQHPDPLKRRITLPE